MHTIPSQKGSHTASTTHGFNPDGHAVVRDGGWWLQSTSAAPIIVGRITCAQAAIEALRGGVVIYGVDGGEQFEKNVAEHAKLPEFEHYGVAPGDAVMQVRALDASRFRVSRLRNLKSCLEVAGAGNARVHVSKGSGLWHLDADCRRGN